MDWFTLAAFALVVCFLAHIEYQLGSKLDKLNAKVDDLMRQKESQNDRSS